MPVKGLVQMIPVVTFIALHTIRHHCFPMFLTDILPVIHGVSFTILDEISNE